MNKKVKVSLSSYQDTEAGVEEFRVSAPGTYSLINDRHFIKYEEKTDDNAINKVLLKFDNNFLEMTKSGEVRSTLTFTEGDNTEGYYKTPYGTFLIETDTKKLDVKTGKKNIFVNLEYGLYIDSEFVADCKMYIEILF
ncbi:MAG: DUF1934 domain-containing protein [Lachnospiraceae bacterium]|jgi:hypothetical protein|nr:DUF1934 domain-containing protein [Lachnospiraceae bacterium]